MKTSGRPWFEKYNQPYLFVCIIVLIKYRLLRLETGHLVFLGGSVVKNLSANQQMLI